MKLSLLVMDAFDCLLSGQLRPGVGTALRFLRLLVKAQQRRHKADSL